jgi:hypothetical protein
MTRKYKRQSKKEYKKKMIGGALSQEEINLLQNQGITNTQIEALQDFDVDYNYVVGKITEVENELGENWQGNAGEVIDEVMNRIFNEQMDENVIMNQGAMMNQEDDYNDLGPMNIEELENTPMDIDDGLTDNEDFSQPFGGKRKTRKTRKGRKSRKTRKGRKSRKTRKGKKVRKNKYGGSNTMTATWSSDKPTYIA